MTKKAKKGKPAAKKKAAARVAKRPAPRPRSRPKPAPRPAPKPAARPASRPAARLPAPAARPPARPAREEPRVTYFRDLAIGDELPVMQKGPVNRVQIARYAGASGDYGVLHVDEAAARAAGMPSVMAHGMLAMAWAGEHVLSWLKGGRLRRLTTRFIKIVWPGDTLTFRARIAALGKEGNTCLVDIDQRAENQKGELVLRGAATCEVYFGPDDEKIPMPPVELAPWPEPKRPEPPPPPPAPKAAPRKEKKKTAPKAKAKAKKKK
jgi:acyl dehydratase